MYRLRFPVIAAGVSAKKIIKKSFQNNLKLFIVSSMRLYFNKGFILIDLTSRGNWTFGHMSRFFLNHASSQDSL